MEREFPIENKKAANLDILSQKQNYWVKNVATW